MNKKSGKNIEENPNVFQQIIKNGHRIGNHTNNHLNCLNTTTTNYLENIDLAEQSIQKEVKNKSNKLFRPPYGKLKFKASKLIRNKGYKIIMWDVLSADFDLSISSEKCLQNVLKNAKSGSIVVFHDSLKASTKLKFALPKVLEHYNNKGFRFKSI